jgi:Domain of unknown function (DUF397)
VDADLSRAVWHKSTFSNGNGGDCVEAARNLPGIVAVRDSKNPDRPALVVSDQAWSKLLRGIKHGEFDL